ncbi:hypothetical protein Bca4012_035854 [Brassica carinata]
MDPSGNGSGVVSSQPNENCQVFATDFRKNMGFRRGVPVVGESSTRFVGRRSTTLYLGNASSHARTTRLMGFITVSHGSLVSRSKLNGSPSVSRSLRR